MSAYHFMALMTVPLESAILVYVDLVVGSNKDGTVSKRSGSRSWISAEI